MRKSNNKILIGAIIILSIIALILYFGISNNLFFLGALTNVRADGLFKHYVIPVKDIPNCNLKLDAPARDSLLRDPNFNTLGYDYIGGIILSMDISGIRNIWASFEFLNPTLAGYNYYTIFHLRYVNLSSDTIKEYLLTTKNDGNNYVMPPLKDIVGCENGCSILFNIYYCENDYNPQLQTITEIIEDTPEIPIEPPIEPSVEESGLKGIALIIMIITIIILILILIYRKTK